MLKSFISKLIPWSSKTNTASTFPSSQAFIPDDDRDELAISKYPPSDQGIKLTSIDSLIESQKDLINRVFRTAGVSREEFAKHFMVAIRNLAHHVHLLPATSTTYFRGTGGLFRMSLEIALHSLQSANAAVFPSGGGVERRYAMTPKWTLATFLAGLCSQSYRTVNSMAVMSSENQQWSPLMGHLYDWAIAKKANVYYIRWMDDAQINGAQAAAAYGINYIIPGDVLSYLAEDNNQVVQAMTAAIAGVEISASENPISRLVAPVVTRVIEDDLNHSAINYGHLVIGAHLEPHLIDAMRRLVRAGKWIPNHAQTGRIWAGKEGVFVDWIPASQDIANLLARDSFAGVPKDPDTLADLLVHAGLLEMTSKGERYWMINVPETFEAREGMVKIKKGSVVFPDGFDLSSFNSISLTISGAMPVTLTTVAPSTQALQAAGENKPKVVPEAEAPPQPRNTPTVIPSATEEAQTPPVADLERSNPKLLEGESSKDTGSGNTSTKRPKKAASEKSSKPEMTTTPQSEQVESNPQSPAPQKTSDKKSGAEGSAGSGKRSSEMMRSKLLSSLKPGNAILLGDVIDNFEKNTLTGQVADLGYGVGISNDELASHGQPVMELFEELAAKHWLWVDRSKPSRKLHLIDMDGKPVSMMILKSDIAVGLGVVGEKQNAPA